MPPPTPLSSTATDPSYRSPRAVLGPVGSNSSTFFDHAIASASAGCIHTPTSQRSSNYLRTAGAGTPCIRFGDADPVDPHRATATTRISGELTPVDILHTGSPVSPSDGPDQRRHLPPPPPTPVGEPGGGDSNSGASNDLKAASRSIVGFTGPSARPRPQGCHAVPVPPRPLGHDPVRLAPVPRLLVAVVRFRYRRDSFLMAADIATQCPTGRVVVVEGDRGEDAGTVEAVEWTNPSTHTVPHFAVLRIASPAEEQALRKMTAVAGAATTAVNERLHCWVRSRPRLRRNGIQIIDCEYQMDGTKLFVHYTANHPIAVKELVVELYKKFRCRVWMNQVNFEAVRGSRV